MKLNIKKTIELFDEKIPENSGHISGVIGLLGEELLVKIFARYLESLKYQVKIYNETPKNGEQKGPRLDAWIEAKSKNERILYQAEVKNWSAYAVNGKSAPLNIDKESLKTQAKNKFNQQFIEHFQSTEATIVNKALAPMKPPFNTNNIKPVIIYWCPISKDGVSPFTSLRPSKILLKKLESPSNFKNVYIFSTSLYLRLLNKKKKCINLNLPKTEKRQAMIKQIFA